MASAEPPSPVTTPTVIQQTLFAQDAVKQLNLGDFETTGRERILLKHHGCYLILFYGENTESLDLVKIWQMAAAQVAGPIFAAVNLMAERKLAEIFTSVRADPDSPLHWASLRGIPFILVYRNGWPVAAYNGERAVQPLIDYALTLACEANYREPVQLAAGMQAQSNLEMPGFKQYEPRTDSTQFTVQTPIRGFDARLQPAVVGSAQARQEAAVAQSEAGTPVSPVQTR